MLLVALTGGIGSGKSTAIAFLAQRGAVVIEADDLAREALAVGTPGLAAVLSRFGEGVLQGDKSLNRSALAEIVFSDPSQRAALEEIVHPLVHRLYKERVANLPADSVVIYEIPLLVETGRVEEFQLVITIETPLSTRIERLAKRGLSQEEAMVRISEQATNEQRRAIADIVLSNSLGETNFLDALSANWRLRLKPFAENLAAHRAAKVGDLEIESLPNLLPLSSQLDRLADRLEQAMDGKIEIVSSNEFNISTAQLDLAAKLGHLGFIEIERDQSYASADPGRPIMLRVIRK